VTDLQDPWVYLSSIPELATILRRGLLAKVRIFEAWCESEQNRDRLTQVIRVGGRPLALAREARPTSVVQVGAPTRRTMRHRVQPRMGMWLDLDPHLYYLPVELAPVSESRVLTPLRFGGQCQHEHLSIPADWLRAQVEQGVRYRVIDAAVRRAAGITRLGE
jgi:hypothetical protein